MEREVFTDPRVIELLNNDFVAVRVDGESRKELDIDGYKITERNLAVREFGVRGYPTFWFLKSDGSKIGPIGGYRPAEFMLEALNFVKEKRYDSTANEENPEED
jgi:thioredoxin-related protein